MCIAEWLTAVGTIFLGLVALFVALFQDRILEHRKRPIIKASIVARPPDCVKTDYSYYDNVLLNTTSGSIALTSGSIVPTGGTIVPTTGSIAPTSGSIVPNTGSTVRPSKKTDAYYCRLRIENNGTQKAEFVEVFASTLWRMNTDGSYKEVETFIPINLKWANQIDRMMFFPAICRGAYKHCDLFHVINPEKRHEIQLEDKEWENVPKNKTILSFDTVVQITSKNYLVGPGTYQLDLIIASANSKPINKKLQICLSGEWYQDQIEMFSKGITISEMN